MVPVDALVDGLWGEHPRGGTVNALHGLVHRLRKALGGAAVVERAAGGYRLHVRAEDVDAYRFEERAKRGGRELAAGAVQRAASLLDEALALWRGAALADVLDAPFAGTAGARLEELRVAAVEDRFEAELRLGHHDEILADMEAVAAEHPLRERLAGLRMRALHAAGRQSDALAVFEQVRGTLAEELGIDPSEELRKTHLAVLRGELEIPEAGQARPEPVPGRLPAPVDQLRRPDEGAEVAGRVAGDLPAGHRRGPRRSGQDPAGRGGGEPASGPSAWPGLARLPGRGEHGGRADRGGAGHAQLPGARPSGTPLDRVVNLLAGGEGVLVLDNCEQISGAVAEFAGQLLERQPYLTILATSREPLEVMGEALCRLGPLGLPRRTRIPLGPPNRPRCGCSSTGRQPYGPASPWTRRPRRRSWTSCAGWTGSRSPWNWPRHGCGP